jgi:hypothetical protein
MLTVKDHNDRAVAAYAAVSGQHWIEAVKDGRHVLIRPLAERIASVNTPSSSACRPSPGTCVFWRRSASPARQCSTN